MGSQKEVKSEQVQINTGNVLQMVDLLSHRVGETEGTKESIRSVLKVSDIHPNNRDLAKWVNEVLDNQSVILLNLMSIQQSRPLYRKQKAANSPIVIPSELVPVH